MSDLRVRDIGEFALISRLEQALPESARSSSSMEVLIGDDAAAARVSAGELIVVTADTMTDGIHFRTDWTSWENIGHKAIAVNLSDLGAMAAVPIMATVSLGLTGNEIVSELELFYRGMGACAANFRCVIAGGDITRTPGPMSIAVTAIGETRGQRMLRRTAARPGDQIWVTGQIGAGAAGLALEMLPDSDVRRGAATAGVLRDALHRPIPRVAAGLALATIGVRCAMDLSDGLSGDLHKILRASNVDALIRIEDLPIPAAVHALFPETATEIALHGGDDFELLFTASPDNASEIAAALAASGTSGTVIGEIRPRSGSEPTSVVIDRVGRSSQIEPRGYDHFGQANRPR